MFKCGAGAKPNQLSGNNCFGVKGISAGPCVLLARTDCRRAPVDSGVAVENAI